MFRVKYLYVLRPLLATLWIEQGRGVAPMRFQDLVDAIVTDHAPHNDFEKNAEFEQVGKLISKARFAFVTTHADGRLLSRPLAILEREFDGDLAQKIIDEMLNLDLLTHEQHLQISAWIARSTSPEEILQMPAPLWQAVERASQAMGVNEDLLRPPALDAGGLTFSQ